VISHDVAASYDYNIGDAQHSYTVNVYNDFSAACPDSTYTVTTTEHPESPIYDYDAATKQLIIVATKNADAPDPTGYPFDFRFEITGNPKNYVSYTTRIYFEPTCEGGVIGHNVGAIYHYYIGDP
jgi:hypothetical protein